MPINYLFQRTLLVFPTLFFILLGVFALLHIAPGDPVELLVDLQVDYIPQERLDRIRQDLGLDRPLYVQFFSYVGRVLQGDLGTSYRSRQPVINDIRGNLWPTLHLALAGMSVALLMGIPAGIISAYKPNTLADYSTLTVSILGLSAPNFWLGILLIYVFAFRLPWLPMTGVGDGDPTSTLRHLLLPSLVIGSSAAALLARLTRSSMLEAMGHDYVRTAYAKGLTPRRVVLKHVLRNATIPIVAAASTMFALLLTGSVVVEMVFARPGLGRLMVQAINNRDFPMVQALILVFGLAITMSNLVSDLLISVLDPRVNLD